jgi:hypothetical protein
VVELPVSWDGGQTPCGFAGSAGCMRIRRACLLKPARPCRGDCLIPPQNSRSLQMPAQPFSQDTNCRFASAHAPAYIPSRQPKGWHVRYA